MSDTSTRSGMLWEVERILSECEEKPQILLMENVPQVHGEGNKEDFNKWQLRLEEMGYKNYWQDLIATDYGIPQNRNRCFMVSVLGEYNYTFPKPIPLKLRLKDMLEDSVDEKYLLTEKTTEKMLKMSGDYKPTGISPTLTTELAHHTGHTLTPKLIKEIQHATNLEKYYLSNEMKNYIISGNNKYLVGENNLKINREVACSVTTREGNTRADTSNYICNDLPAETNLKLYVKNNNSKGYLEAEAGDGIDISGRMEYHRGTVQKGRSLTINTMGGEDAGVVMNNLRIRKLTPKECFRLMGVRDEDFNNVAKNQSDSSLYHLAGDSIVVDVIKAVIKELL